MGRGGKHIYHIVLLSGRDTLLTHSAFGLGSILAHRSALDVARLCEGEDALLLLDQVLNINLILHVLDFCNALIAIFVPDGGEFLLEDVSDHLFGSQQLVIVGNTFFQFFILRLQLLAVQPLEGNETHIAHRLGLDIVQMEPLHQPLLCVIIAGADDADCLINVVLNNQQTFQQVGPFLGFAQVVLGAADDNLLLIGNILIQNVP